MGVLSKLLGGAPPSVSPAEAQSLVKDGALLLDVREPSEWAAGHAPKARHVPLGQLAASLDQLPSDRTIVVVCRSGNRSARAARVLARSGRDVRNLAGGMTAWQAARLPVVGRRGGRGRGRGRVS